MKSVLDFIAFVKGISLKTINLFIDENSILGVSKTLNSLVTF